MKQLDRSFSEAGTDFQIPLLARCYPGRDAAQQDEKRCTLKLSTLEVSLKALPRSLARCHVLKSSF